MSNNRYLKWGAWIAAVALAVAAAAWQMLDTQALPAGFAAGHGRIQAVEIDVAAKTAGRVEEMLVDEGDLVEEGQILVRMDTDVLEAQQREAKAQLRRARIGVEAAASQVVQREAERRAAEAQVAQRRAEMQAAVKRADRARRLAARSAISAQDLDDAEARAQAARAGVAAAEAQVAGIVAAIRTAEAQVIGAESAVEAAQATIERLAVQIEDSALRAPRPGRVQYRVAQPAEVVSPGGVVLNLVDLTSVYMTFFLPTEVVGRLAIGQPARLVLDAMPDRVIPATITFVSDVAQFTPKTVETAEERQKLMFRVKARIDPALLRDHLSQVKTGVPGMAYVRIDPQAQWPERLQQGLVADSADEKKTY